MEPVAVSPKPADTKLEPAFIKPFENIALAFSGGGFRAATFALGVLSYLNRVTFTEADEPLKGDSLLRRVTFMSSASGGTIATTLYALYNANEKDFKAFYVKLYECLNGDFLLQNALEILSDKKRWSNRPLKSRNIINSFAMAYDEFIFDGETIKALYYHGIKGHLQEVCFNTTEFYTGLSFRQDKKMVPDAATDPYFKYGNENIYMDQTVAANIKLGDVLAASSCFPAGFEPIVFPEDFTYNGLSEEALKDGITLKPQTGDKDEKKFIAEKNIGFMDGGITDNQGLQSMMYADTRRLKGQTTFEPFDLMLVNDVGSYFISPYINPPQPKHSGISLRGVYWIMALIAILAGAGIYLGFHFCRIWPALAGGILIVIPLIFLLVVNRLKSTMKGELGTPSGLDLRKSFTDKVINLLLRYLAKTPLVVLKQMLAARANSVLLLNMSVFLKRIRQLLYNTFYGSAEWKNRGKGNHIYDLAFSSDIYRKQNPPPAGLEPNENLKIVAQTAFDMGTTLWFDKTSINQQHSEACITACGQFTTCYNLLGYIEKLLVNPAAYDAVYLKRLYALKEQMLKDYSNFKNDPFFVYNGLGITYGLKDFKPVNVKDIPFPPDWK